jgi:glycosyltransferase involved in cell wall biosynthesis
MPLVSIITRTKERPLTLARAAESVARQTLSDFEWVVVNDGGPKGPVDEVAERSRQRGIAVRVLHNDVSLGMEGASNRGIRESDSEFVVIHDDDDSWQETFLARTTQHLQALPAVSVTRGVVTRATQVIENIRDGQIVEVRRVPYDPDLKAITLFQMARLSRVPPPISFLYRRAALATVGLYRDDLPVLGDWEFNIRFLRHFDIEVLPELLANYHWRMNESGIYGNTVVAGIDRHAVVAARLQNELLRQDLDDGKLGVGFIVNFCHELEAVQGRPSFPVRIISRFLPRWLLLRLIQLARAR